MNQLNTCEIMCFNVYMPCSGLSEDVTFATYVDVLGEIHQLIHTFNLVPVIGESNMDIYIFV